MYCWQLNRFADVIKSACGEIMKRLVDKNVIFRALFVVCFVFSASAFSFAQVPAKSQQPEAEPIIELTPDRRLDKNITTRITGIFSDFEDLQGVTATVDGGIVTLAGEVANENAAQKAVNLTRRLEGVISVNDEISRTLELKGNIEPLWESTKDRAMTLYHALPLIALSFIVFVLIYLIFDRVARFKKLWRWIVPNSFFEEFMAQILRMGGLIFGAIVALNLLGATNFIAAILGGAGVLGLAIGFAVRDALENYVSSIMLSVRQPFRAKDHVLINDKEGVVIRLTSRATVLMTLDGNHLRIPNSQVFKGIIINYTTNPERRFDFTLGVDSNDNPVAAMQIGIDRLKSHDFILNDPQPAAVIDSVGDSNILISFYGWVNQKQVNFARSRSLAIESVMRKLEQEGFSLPEPIYRLRVEDGAGVLIDGTDATKDKAAKPKKAKPADKPVDKTADKPGDLESFDISPDTHLEEKVAEELKEADEQDLLDQERPTE